MLIQENHSLKNLNTFHINASAKYFCEITCFDDIQSLISSDQFKNEQILILGGGSNILFTKDFNGLVIKMGINLINIISETESEVLVEVGAGHDWDQLVEYSLRKGWYGLENLSLIPGTIGASPIQNIGAYGVEIKEVIDSVNGIDLTEYKNRTFMNSECKFAYRDSIFKNELKYKFLITSVVYKLSKSEQINLNYQALKDYFNNRKKDSIKSHEVRDAVIDIRRSKLPDPKKIGNAGSFFKNPIIANQVFNEIKSNHEDLMGFSVGNDLMKISAGWLIQKSGLQGLREGDVGICEKQSLVIVNHGNSSGLDIENFAFKIIEKVKNQFGINLIPEVNII